MTKSKLTQKYTRKIGKTGNVDSPSYFITLPIHIVRGLGWFEGKQVIVRRSRGKIIIDTKTEDGKK